MELTVMYLLDYNSVLITSSNTYMLHFRTVILPGTQVSHFTVSLSRLWSL